MATFALVHVVVRFGASGARVLRCIFVAHAVLASGIPVPYLVALAAHPVAAAEPAPTLFPAWAPTFFPHVLIIVTPLVLGAGVLAIDALDCCYSVV